MAEAFSWDKIAEGGVLSAFFYGCAPTQIVGGAPRTASGGNVLLFAGMVAGDVLHPPRRRRAPRRCCWRAPPGRRVWRSRRCTRSSRGTSRRAAHHRGGHGHGGVLRRGVRVRRDPRPVLAGGWEAAFYASAPPRSLSRSGPARFQVVTSRDSSAKARSESARDGTSDRRRVRRRFPTTRQTRFARRKTIRRRTRRRAREWWVLAQTREVRAIRGHSSRRAGQLRPAELARRTSTRPWAFLSSTCPLSRCCRTSSMPAGVPSGAAPTNHRRCGHHALRAALVPGGDGGPGGLPLAAAAGCGGLDGRVADANAFAPRRAWTSAWRSRRDARRSQLSHLDVAPKHAGLVFATGNTCATIAGPRVPVSGLILERTNQNWSVVSATPRCLCWARRCGARGWGRTRRRGRRRQETRRSRGLLCV